MNKGLFGPLRLTFRDFHYWEHFGAAAPASLPLEVRNDRGLTHEVQPFADTRCTALTTTKIATNQDGIPYSADFQMMETLKLMGVGPDHSGADPRAAFKVPLYKGLLEKRDEPVSTETVGQLTALDPGQWKPESRYDALADLHKKPAYLRADTGPYDVFDNLRSCLALGAAVQRTIGIATPWYWEWENGTGPDGILAEAPATKITDHMYYLGGYVVRNTSGALIRSGEPFLDIISYNDDTWGDSGHGYLSRAAVNRQFRNLFNPASWGSIALTFEKLDPQTIESLKMRISELEDILATVLQNQIIKLQAQLTNH